MCDDRWIIGESAISLRHESNLPTGPERLHPLSSMAAEFSSVVERVPGESPAESQWIGYLQLWTAEKWSRCCRIVGDLSATKRTSPAAICIQTETDISVRQDEWIVQRG